MANGRRRQRLPSEAEEGRGAGSQFAERLVIDPERQKAMVEDYDQNVKLGEANAKRAMDDLALLLGDQWTPQEKEERGGRPTLVDNKLPPSYHQLKNDVRQNLPAPKLKPRGDAHADTALILDGLLRYIGNRSNAPEHRMQAVGQSISSGFGYYYVTKEWASQDGFEQELRIKGLPNRHAVVDDWTATEPDLRDRKCLYVVNPLPEREFKAKYPHNSAEKGKLLDGSKLGGNWRLAPKQVPEILYWWREIFEWKTITSKTEKDPDTGDFITRDVPAWRVCWMFTNGQEVLLNRAGQPLRGVWDGQWIPYLLVTGWRELVVDNAGQAAWHIEGAFTQARDPQRLGNYTKSNMMEVIGQQPKAKMMIPEGADEGHEAEWQNMNTTATPGIHYRAVPGPNGTILKPEPIMPATLGDGLPMAIQWADNAVRDAIGMFQGAKGEATNDPSGYALEQRRIENDTNHLHFMASIALAMKFEAEICVDLIVNSKLYGPESKVWVAFEDGTEQQITINSPQAIPEKPKSTWTDLDENRRQRRHYDLRVGSYEVAMQIGPNFATQREEERAGMLEAMKIAPNYAPLIMPKYVKAANWRDADIIAQAMLATLPPNVAQLLTATPMPSDAATLQQMRTALGQQQQIIQSLVPALQQLQGQLKDKRLEHLVKLVVEAEKVTAQKMREVSHLMGTEMKTEGTVLSTAMKGDHVLLGQEHAARIENTRREGEAALNQAQAEGQDQVAQLTQGIGGGGGAPGGAPQR